MITNSRRGDFVEFSFQDSSDVRDSAVEVAVPKGLRQQLRESGRVVLDSLPVWGWRNPDKPPHDVVHTPSGATLFSERVRGVVDAHLGPADEVQWIAAELELLDAKRVRYWVAHLPVHHDVLSDDGTDWQDNGVPIRYAYSRSKLTGHCFTSSVTRPARVTVPGVGVFELGTQRVTSAYLVTGALCDALRSVGITGARLVPAPMTAE